MKLMRNVSLALMVSGATVVCAMEEKTTGAGDDKPEGSAGGRRDVVMSEVSETTASGDRAVVFYSDILDEDKRSLMSGFFDEYNRLFRENESFSCELSRLTAACNVHTDEMKEKEKIIDSLEAELRALDATKADLIKEADHDNERIGQIHLTIKDMLKESTESLGKMLSDQCGVISIDPNLFDLGRVPTQDDFTALFGALSRVKDIADPSAKNAIDMYYRLVMQHHLLLSKKKECLKNFRAAEKDHAEKHKTYKVLFAAFKKDEAKYVEMRTNIDKVFVQHQTASKKLADFLARQAASNRK